MSTSPASRLRRIQIVSRVFMGLFLCGFAYMAFSLIMGLYLWCAEGTIFSHPGYSRSYCQQVNGVFVVTALLDAATAWAGFRLFQLYARGELFTARQSHYLQRLGWLYMILILDGTLLFHMLPPDTHLRTILPPGTETALYLLPGVLLLLVGWIMDEGRKIREEQELTV